MTDKDKDKEKIKVSVKGNARQAVITLSETASKEDPKEGNGTACPAKGNDKDRSRKSAANDSTDADKAPTLEDIIKGQATEEEAPHSSHFTLKRILGGDILNTSTIRHQVGVLLLITFFTFVYIANRYSYQQGLIKLDKLQDELQDAKYRALSTSSELTEKCRESNVLEQLKNNKDSVLKIASQPPYKIQVPEE